MQVSPTKQNPKPAPWDFPGDPVAKTLHSQCRGLRFYPWSGTRSHMQKLRVCMMQLHVPCAATKTQCRQKKRCKYTLHTPTWLHPFFGKSSETHSLSPRDSLPFSPRVPPAPCSSFYRSTLTRYHHGLSSLLSPTSGPYVNSRTEL